MFKKGDAMFKRLLIACIGVTLCLGVFSVITSAQIQEKTFSITPQIGGYRFQDSQNLKHGVHIGFGTGYNFTDTFGTEFTFNRIITPWQNGTRDINGSMLRLDGIFHLMPQKKVVPYLAVGAGSLMLFPMAANQTSTHFMLNYGGGIKAFVKGNVAIRADVRHVRTSDAIYHNLMYTAGLDFLFGGSKKSAPPVKAAAAAPAPQAAPAPPVDSDNDGVIDVNDKCPNTPAGVKVNSDGCPLDSDSDGVYDYLDKCPNTPTGVKVNSNGCPLDSDGDGVYDYLDKCPNTPSGVKVNSDGCPLDSDGDGVYDYLDKCPNTPSGVKVNSDGCPLDSDGDGVYDYLDKCPDTPRDLKVNSDGCPIQMKKKLTKDLNIEFDTNKAVIKPQYNDRLKEFADFMAKYPETTAVIEGHTDNVGSAAANKKLSQKRADAVRTALIKNFIVDTNRLTAKGYGKDKPIASNDTIEGRQTNRRIQATISAESEYFEKK
jgi:OmpA-OmpF porin, OOP family